MSETVIFNANKGTTTRKATDGTPTQGAGACKRLYVGRYGSYDYRAYLNFDFTGIPSSGRVVSAILTLSTDDGLGILGDTQEASDNPQVRVRRLTSAFSEGTNSATFDNDDYTLPLNTSTGAVAKNVSPGSTDATNIDITQIFEAWGPAGLKRTTGKPCLNATRHGLLLYGDGYSSHNSAFVSEDAEGALAAFEPYITLTYELGPTTPTAPTNLSPSGAVDAIGSFQGTFEDPRATDKLTYSGVQVYDRAHTFSTWGVSNNVSHTSHGLVNGDQVYFTRLVGGTGASTFTKYYVVQKTTNTFKVSTSLNGAELDITNDYTDGDWSKLLYNVSLPASNTEMVNGIFDHVPSNFHPIVNTTYRWRGRCKDNEGIWGAWSSLVSFSVTNTDPNAPTLSPVNGTSLATMADTVFSGGTFSDADADDFLLAYEVQLSAYPEGSAQWDDDEFILWNTGKRYVSDGSTDWRTFYGGQSLDTGTYYWRARQYDNHHGVSDWTYASIILTADFEVEPVFSVNSIQMRPRAPWRIVIRNMGALRGPGTVVAILEDAMNVGASIMYNSPGEMHFTLGIKHPQISVIEAKQTHYAIEFRQGDGWREVFAGLVWDWDGTDTDIVFYGIDYLALYDLVVDERFKASNAEAAYNKGGSKYSSIPIRTIIADQLLKAKALANSPVGFITVSTVPTELDTPLTYYSTYKPVLQSVVNLIDSYRAGSGKRTRVSVQKSTTGYAVVVDNNPGTVRSDLRMRYGELVQGYRLVPFGSQWGTRAAAIGRDKDGVKVRYRAVTAPNISEATWGRFVLPNFFDGISDDNDLIRRARQFITQAAAVGKQLGLGLRSGVLNPRDGYDVCDLFPIDIDYGPIDTANYGHDSQWVAVGITWQAKEDGDQNTTITFQPKESGTAPSTDLLESQPISTQAEWQIGWTPPNPLTATSRYWYDGTTGIVYERVDGDLIVVGITGDV